MKLSAHLLLAAIAFCSFATLFGFPMDGFPVQNCRCLRTTHAKISYGLLQKLEIIPAGAYCRRIEIIVTKRNNSTVCVAPDVEWVQPLIMKAMERKTNHQKFRELLASKATSTTQSS